MKPETAAFLRKAHEFLVKAQSEARDAIETAERFVARIEELLA